MAMMYLLMFCAVVKRWGIIMTESLTESLT